MKLHSRISVRFKGVSEEKNLNPSSVKIANRLEDSGYRGYLVDPKGARGDSLNQAINNHHKVKMLKQCLGGDEHSEILKNSIEKRENNFLKPLQSLLKCNNRLANESKPSLPHDVIKKVASILEKVY